VSPSASGDAPDQAGGGESPPSTTSPTGAGAAGTPTGEVQSAPQAATPAPRTRTGRAFNLLVAGAIVLILLLVFILENTQSVKISYFGASGHLPLGVALLLAAIGGALIVGIVGAARIVQLRRHVKRRR
jgi:uncharacterized integral membrane protein